MDLEALGVPAVVTAIVGGAGLYWRSLLAERAASIKADRAQIEAERSLRDQLTKERIAEANAREKALADELRAERVAHHATDHKLTLALESLRDEIGERSAEQTRLLLEATQRVLGAIADRKISAAAMKAAREVGRLSGDYTEEATASEEESLDIPPPPERPLERQRTQPRIPRQDPPARPRSAEGSQPLRPLTGADAERALRGRR